MFVIPAKDEDIPFIKLACLMNDYEFRFTLDDDDKNRIAKIFASETKKDEFLKDVACEKQSVLYGGLPVYSYETLVDEEKLAKFQRKNWTTSFMGLKEDGKIINEKILMI